MPNSITPYAARIITSSRLQRVKRGLAEKRRIRKKQPHRVTVYLRINDPYSYVLLQVLGQLANQYPLQYDFRTVLSLQPEMYPAPTLWEKNAFNDGAYLAGLYDLVFPAERPQTTPQRDAQITAQLLHWELQPGYLANALSLFEAYWRSDDGAVQALIDSNIASHVECYQHHLQANENLLKSNGHYLSAMLHYGGEWYWGLDRLEHLENRLNAMGLGPPGNAEVRFNRGYQNFCCQVKPDKISAENKHKAIELYWSIRSPYSYLALLRGRKLAEHYHVPLLVKPVLPMVMRRMQVPKTKSSYIALDTKGEVSGAEVDVVVSLEVANESPLVLEREELVLPPPPPHAVKRKSTAARAKVFFIFEIIDIVFTLV